MPRRKRETVDKTESGNGHAFNTQKLAGYVRRVEKLQDEQEAERETCRENCAQIKTEIDTVLDEAANEGIPKVELKAAIKARVLNRKIEKIRNGLDGDRSRDSYDAIRLALGDLADTPLGRAATGEAPQPTA